jgi:glycosyltransferase involved in cell wall biosynthesis
LGLPYYLKFPVYHFIGLSNGYITHADWSAFRLNKNLIQSIKSLLQVAIQIYYSRKADFFVFQTEEARFHFCKRALVRKSNSIVIPNAYDEDMIINLSGLPSKKKTSIVTIFCPGGGYTHKGFQFIPAIACELSKLIKEHFKFVVTVPEGNLLDEMNKSIEKLGVKEFIDNIGTYQYTNAAPLYNNADIVFVPSLLETFSASYLEAMAAKKILVAANKGFAREVCDNAAVYVDPANALQTAKVLSTVILHPEDFEINKENGYRILKKYGNQKQRFDKIMELLILKSNQDPGTE